MRSCLVLVVQGKVFHPEPLLAQGTDFNCSFTIHSSHCGILKSTCMHSLLKLRLLKRRMPRHYQEALTDPHVCTCNSGLMRSTCTPMQSMYPCTCRPSEVQAIHASMRMYPTSWVCIHAHAVHLRTWFCEMQLTERACKLHTESGVLHRTDDRIGRLSGISELLCCVSLLCLG